MISEEKRTHPRVETRLSARLSVFFLKEAASSGFLATLLDYSSGGARVTVRAGHEAERLVDRLQTEDAMLVAHVPMSGGPPIKIVGQVRWAKLLDTREGIEVGMRVIEIDHETLAALDRLASGASAVAAPAPRRGWVWPVVAVVALLLAGFAVARAAQQARAAATLAGELEATIESREHLTTRLHEVEAKAKAIEAKLRAAEAPEAPRVAEGQ